MLHRLLVRTSLLAFAPALVAACSSSTADPTPTTQHAALASDNPVRLYYSDYCNEADFLRTVYPSTNCGAIAGDSRSVWGIKVGSTCYDVRDTSFLNGCQAFKGAGDSDAIALYESDSCSSDLEAFVDNATACSSISGMPSVWGVKRSGRACEDISDLSFSTACTQYANEGGTVGSGAVELYHSDFCSGSPVARVDERTSCSALPIGLSDTWGVRINGGACVDVNDTDTISGCKRYQAASNPSATAVYHSDFCSSSLLAYVGPQTNCSAMGVTDSVWGVRTSDGADACIDIVDTSFSQACETYKSASGGSGGGPAPGDVQIFSSSNCTGTTSSGLLGTVDYLTDCRSWSAFLSGQAWSVLYAGRCLPIEHTDPKTACAAFQWADTQGASAIFRSNYCSSDPIAFAGPKPGAVVNGHVTGTDCSYLNPLFTQASGVQPYNKACIGITPTSIASACSQLQDGLAGGPLTITAGNAAVSDGNPRIAEKSFVSLYATVGSGQTGFLRNGARGGSLSPMLRTSEGISVLVKGAGYGLMSYVGDRQINFIMPIEATGGVASPRRYDVEVQYNGAPIATTSIDLYTLGPALFTSGCDQAHPCGQSNPGYFGKGYPSAWIVRGDGSGQRDLLRDNALRADDILELYGTGLRNAGKDASGNWNVGASIVTPSGEVWFEALYAGESGDASNFWRDNGGLDLINLKMPSAEFLTNVPRGVDIPLRLWVSYNDGQRHDLFANASVANGQSTYFMKVRVE